MGYRNKVRRRIQRNDKEASVQAVQAHFKHQEDSAYAEALVGLFSRSNTILSGREIQCSLSETVQVAATDGTIIYFNVGQVAALVRGLRIQRRIPNEEEYRQACLALQNGEWQDVASRTTVGWYDSPRDSNNIQNKYLFRKFKSNPELFGTDWNSLGQLVNPRSYEEFVRLLSKHELADSIKSFASLRGLNYHELSHCLYTPSANSSLRKSVIDLANRIQQRNMHGIVNKIAGFTDKELAEEAELACSPSPATIDYDEKYRLEREWRKKVDEWNKKCSAKIFRRYQVHQLLNTPDFWHKMWNTLEDQRIESLFVAKFPTARHFFTATVLRYIANHKVSRDHAEVLKRQAKDGGGNEPDVTKKGSAFLLIHGRRYLPKPVRDKYRALLQSDYNLSNDEIEKVESVIDKYRALANFKNSAEVEAATDIVWDFGLWVASHIEEVALMPEPDGGFAHDQHKGGSAQTKRENAEDQQRRQEQEEQWDSEEEQEDSDDQGDFSSSDDESEDDSDSDDGDESDEEDSDDDASGNSSEESDEEDSSASGDGAGNKSDGDGDARKNRRPQDSDSSTAGKKSGDSVATSNNGNTIDDSIRELLNQAEEAIGEDALRQIDALHDLVKKERASRFFRELWKPDATTEPPVLYRSLSNAISNSLTKLRSDRDNQWEKGAAVGVVNVLRYAEARGTHTDFFDEWQEDGDERPDAEICVLLDLSTSMNNESWSSYKERQKAGVSFRTYDDNSKTNAYEASCAMWAIKYACQRNDIPCSVIGYSDNQWASLPIYENTDTVTSGAVPLFNGLSGTRPKEAIQIAQAVLEKSDARHRILVSLSDGDWVVHHADLKPIITLKKLGVQTVFIQLPDRIEQDPTTKETVVRFSRAGKSHTDNKAKNQYYCHEHHLQVEDSSALTKRIGAILLKAVQNR